MNKRKVICWILVLFLIIGIVVMINNPPIERSEKGNDGLNCYNRFVKKCLSEQFEMWDIVSRNEGLISEHFYRYFCAFAGNPTFLISVKMQFDNLDEYRIVYQQARDAYPVNKMGETLNICGNASEDYQWFFDSVINDGRHVYLEYSIMNEEKMTIQFVFALLYDEMEKDEKTIEIANTGYVIEHNFNYEAFETERD